MVKIEVCANAGRKSVTTLDRWRASRWTHVIAHHCPIPHKFGHGEGCPLRQRLVELPLVVVELAGDDLDVPFRQVEDPLPVDLGRLESTKHDGLEDDLKLLHRVLCPAGLDGLGDLLPEGVPAVERTTSQEGKQREQLVDVVLNRRTGLRKARCQRWTDIRDFARSGLTRSDTT